MAYTVVEVDVNAGELPAFNATSPLLGVAMRSSSVHDTPSSPRADARAAGLVRQLLAADGVDGRKVLLLPRPGWWLATPRDAVRLAMRVNRPEVGLSLCIDDWLASAEDEMQALLDLIFPRLWEVRGPVRSKIDNPRVIELMARLRRMGYNGTFDTA